MEVAHGHELDLGDGDARALEGREERVSVARDVRSRPAVHLLAERRVAEGGRDAGVEQRPAALAAHEDRDDRQAQPLVAAALQREPAGRELVRERQGDDLHRRDRLRIQSEPERIHDLRVPAVPRRRVRRPRRPGPRGDGAPRGRRPLRDEPGEPPLPHRLPAIWYPWRLPLGRGRRERATRSCSSTGCATRATRACTRCFDELVLMEYGGAPRTVAAALADRGLAGAPSGWSAGARRPRRRSSTALADALRATGADGGRRGLDRRQRPPTRSRPRRSSGSAAPRAMADRALLRAARRAAARACRSSRSAPAS